VKISAFHTIKLEKMYIAFKLQKEIEGAASQDVLREKDVVTSRKMKEFLSKQYRETKEKNLLYTKYDNKSLILITTEVLRLMK